MDAQWQWNIGLRIAVNTYAWQRNYQNYIDYQTGYAMNFGEHFALTTNGSTKLAGGKHKWRLDAIMGATLSRNSKLSKYWRYGFNQDGVYIRSDSYDIAKNNPHTHFEFGIGFKFAYKINNYVQIYASGMVGAFLGPQIQYGTFYDSDDNSSSNLITVDTRNFLGLGSLDMVGFEGLPILSVGLRYQLNTRKQEKSSTVK